jgi:ribosomal protein S24E
MASISRLGKAADIMENSLLKVKEIAIEVTHRSYDDKMARSATEVVVTEVLLLGIKQVVNTRITKKNSCNLHFNSNKGILAFSYEIQ